MPLFENCPLADKHTFHIAAETRFWADYDTIGELQSLLRDDRFKGLPILPVGGGSNLLFTKNFPGLLLHSNLKTLEKVGEEGDSVLIRVGSGVVWDDLVAYTVENGWSGIENLSGIPGEVGASPVQNIGAYGAEAKDCIEWVDAMDLKTLQIKRFSRKECRFGYRNSIFKQELKNKFIVCYVTYRLSITFNANLKYGNLAGHLEKMGGVTLTSVRKTILEIRNEKLPDPSVIGNAGSFFMNPEIPSSHYQELLESWPQMPGWPLENGLVKVSAAWCIDQAGWKGKSLGNAAVHDKQSLVLVNSGKATAAEVIVLCNRIVKDVRTKFGIALHPEVLFI
jgi:UDP-N-acetylmuramate dehydrogenase